MHSASQFCHCMRSVQILFTEGMGLQCVCIEKMSRERLELGLVCVQ
jgi:3,4-dihydroxy-2-butanone 4-phosphate synthase